MAHSPKILVVGAAWIGDMVMAHALCRLLKQRQPSAQIDVIAPSWTQPLLERMPEVSQAISLPIGHGQLKLGERYRLARQLRAKHYDQAVVLPNSWKSALIPFWAKIKKRTGWRGEMRWGLLNDLRYLDKKQWPLMVQRFLALALEEGEPLPETYPYPRLQVNKQQVVALRERLQLTDQQRPILALCPGAEFGPAKRWPSEHYAALANRLLAQDWQVWLFGSPKEQEVAQAIQQLTEQRCVDLTGKTQLGEAIDLLSLAHAVVSNDSGLMHIAAALQRPQVVIYGSTTPGFTPPLNKQAEILSLNLSCSPCFQRECPLTDEKHLQCLTQLTPERVEQAIFRLIQ